MNRVLGTLGLFALSILSTGKTQIAEAGGYRNYQPQTVIVKEQQLLIPVVVNPYQFSYNGQVAAANAQYVQQPVQQQVQQLPPQQQLQAVANPQAVANSQPVTRGEFLEAMSMLIAALEGKKDQEYLQEHGGLDRRPAEAAMISCKTCHSQPDKKPPQLFVEGRLKSDDELDWETIDQLVRNRLMPPADHAPLPDEQAIAISKYASDYWLWRRKQPVASRPEGDILPTERPGLPPPPVPNPNPNTGTAPGVPDPY